jgi:hypothetical protein
MKKILLPLLLLCAPAAFAGGTFKLDTHAANLPAGTKVRLEISAEYRMNERPKPPANGQRVLRLPVSEEMIRYRAKSQNAGVWQFTVAPNSAIPTPEMELRFEKDFPEPVAGLSSGLFFPIKYTIDVPARNGKPARQIVRQIETSLDAPEPGEPGQGCLRVEYIGEDALFVGITPSCSIKLYDTTRRSGGH